MIFFKKCGRSCIRFLIGCSLMILIALGLSKVTELYLKVDVYEDFIQDYFELTDNNSSKLTETLLKSRDETKAIKKIRISKYPDTNSYIDVINSVYRDKMKKLEELEDLLKDEVGEVTKLKKFLKEENRKFNNKAKKDWDYI